MTMLLAANDRNSPNFAERTARQAAHNESLEKGGERMPKISSS
jgi:hypothetical protein